MQTSTTRVVLSALSDAQQVPQDESTQGTSLHVDDARTDGARMTTSQLLDGIASAAPEELPPLALALATRMASAASTATKMAPGDSREAADADAWITPERAAEIAGEQMSTPAERRRAVRRIYAWAQGQRWAARPSRKCLRVSERGFRKWLANRG
jgi:hypothetical protein